MKSLPFLPQATAALMIGLTCLSNPVFAKESPANKPAASNGKLSPNLSSDATKETNRIDGIAAIISDEIITTSELANKTRLIEQQMTAQKVQMPDPNTLRQQVLNRMVLDRAQIRRAKDLGIAIEESQVDSAMETVAQRNNTSLKDFLASLTRQGFSSKEFREEIRNELLITKLRQQEVDSKIKVTESEVDSFLNTQVAPNANKRLKSTGFNF